MRIVYLATLLFGLALAGVGSSLRACGGDFDLTPTAIKFPGSVQACQLRGDYLVCLNDANRLVVADLKRGKTFDLGTLDGRRWHDADVADGRALLLVKDRLHLVALDTGKIVADVAIGSERVWAFGFAGKGQAFVHRGKGIAIVELATGKTLHTIEIGEDDFRRGIVPWQKVGSRLFIVGPATTVCVIDLDTGKLRDRFAVEARAGIAALQVEGGLVYCIGYSQFTWAPRIDHLVCLDMESRKSILIGLPREVRGFCRFGSGPYGTVYVTDENRIQRYTMAGDRCGDFTTPAGQPVLAVWRQRALIADKNEIRLLEIKETPVTRK